MHQHRGLGGGIVLHLPYLYLAFLECLKNRLNKRSRGFAERQLGDIKRLGIEFLYFGSHLDRTAATAVVVAANVNHAAGGKIGV